MQRMYATKAATRARQQSNDTSNRTGTKQGDDRTQQHTKKGYCRTEGKLVAKAGKLIKGLGSGKAGSGSKLWPVRQLATEPQEQAKTRKKNTKTPKKNNLRPNVPEKVTIMR